MQSLELLNTCTTTPFQSTFWREELRQLLQNQQQKPTKRRRRQQLEMFKVRLTDSLYRAGLLSRQQRSDTNVGAAAPPTLQGKLHPPEKCKRAGKNSDSFFHFGFRRKTKRMNATLNWSQEKKMISKHCDVLFFSINRPGVRHRIGKT